MASAFRKLPSQWLNVQLPRVCYTGAVGQKEKQMLHINIYVKSRKMVQVILFAKQKQRHRCREQTYGHQGGRRGWDELGDQY